MLDNSVEWQQFKMNDIFKFSKGKRLIKDDMIDGDLNYIGAISENNGVRQKIDAIPTHLGNCITVNYNGSVGEAFYQEDAFWASDDVNVLELKDNFLNHNIGLFLCTIIKANKSKFGYGRKWTLEKMKETNLLLPVDNKGELNLLYMEQYISNLCLKLNFDNIIKTSVVKKHIPLNTHTWQLFKLADLFTFKRGKRLTQEDRVVGNIPLVTAGEGNQGVKDFISNESQQIHNHCITIDMFCNSYYHGYDFMCDDNILALTPKENISKYAMIFISTIISKDKYQYQYGRQYRVKNFQKHAIKLPTTPNYTPDWQFMEDYIKSLAYSDKI